MERPLFSIIIPVYNRENLVDKTIDSVLNQQFIGYEIIVINDGSTDNTDKVLCNYANTIRIFNQDNKGAEEARNYGAENASGDYLVFLDSDDILLPEALSIYQKLIKAHNDPPLVFTKGHGFKDNKRLTELIEADKKDVYYKTIKNYYCKTEPLWIATSFLIFKRSFWNQKICFKKNTVDDLDFILRIGNLGPCIIVKSPATVAYRSHQGNSIHDIVINLIRLKNMLTLEQQGEYPGGKKRKLDRMAILGGHIFEWSIRGIKKGHYKDSLQLLLKGVPALLAGVQKKIWNHIFKHDVPVSRM